MISQGEFLNALTGIGVVSGGNISCVKMDDGKFNVDDTTYYSIINFAYSELAVVLGKWMGVFLPHPDTAVKETIKTVTDVLESANQEKLIEALLSNPIELLLSRTTRSIDNNDNNDNNNNGMHTDDIVDENDHFFTARNGTKSPVAATDIEMSSSSPPSSTESKDEETQQQVVNDV